MLSKEPGHLLIQRCYWINVTYLSAAFPTTEQTFSELGPVSGPLAGARKRKMNEMQPLPPKRSESSRGHSDGFEMVIY